MRKLFFGKSKFSIITSAASETAAMQFISPYSSCSYGESLTNMGCSTLLIYDDLSKHAVAYRQLSLLLRRPPGREAYPGDVFYLHSRLLERASKLSENTHGGGSLTSLPIIETQAGDVSAYIPTNVISITDGQLFLESDIFYKGIRPALSYGLSVSRIGSAAQNKVLKKTASSLKLELAQYREVEVFSQFDYELDFSTKMQLIRGEALIECLKQDQYLPYPMLLQILIVTYAINGFLDQFGSTNIYWFKRVLIYYIIILLINIGNPLNKKNSFFNLSEIFLFNIGSYDLLNRLNSYKMFSIFLFFNKWILGSFSNNNSIYYSEWYFNFINKKVSLFWNLISYKDSIHFLIKTFISSFCSNELLFLSSFYKKRYSISILV